MSNVLTLPIREVIDATPRARVVRVDLQGRAFPYKAGQAVFAATSGSELRKPYSLAISPAEAARLGYLELLVGLDENGEAGPHLALGIDTMVDVEGPIGTFTFPDAPVERRFLFVAGGTGIAPLRAMLHEAVVIDGAEVSVLYSARTPREFAYGDELQRLAREGRIELRQTVTRDSGAEWPGSRGRLGRADLEPLVHAAPTLAFICGPPSLVDEIPAQLEALGIPRGRIRIEEWG